VCICCVLFIDTAVQQSERTPERLWTLTATPFSVLLSRIKLTRKLQEQVQRTSAWAKNIKKQEAFKMASNLKDPEAGCQRAAVECLHK